MSVKKLTGNIDTEVLLEVNENSGLLLMKGDPRPQCFYLEAPSRQDCSKLHRYGALEGAKFVGGQRVLSLLKDVLGKALLAREIAVEGPVEVAFDPETGKVRVRKDQLPAAPVEARGASKKKVLIIDDSKTIQKLLKKIVGSSKKLEVLDVADRPSAAKKIIEKIKPDLITLDIHMPEMNGVEFLKTYLKDLKIPVVMVSSVSLEEGPLVMEALSNGALTYIQKPSLDKMSEIAPDILDQLESLANKRDILANRSGAGARAPMAFENFDGLVAIGSSTGGTKALQEILTALPDKIPPIVVVQHIPAVFSKALAERLNSLCVFNVKEAVDGEEVSANTVYIAPGGIQMKLARRGSSINIVLKDDPPINRFKPSVDYMFESIPALKETNVVAAILTGMGKDGAKGLLELKNAGAYTFAQDEASCVVFGMPKEAIRLNAAKNVVDLSEMAVSFVEAFNAHKNIKSA